MFVVVFEVKFWYFDIRNMFLCLGDIVYVGLFDEMNINCFIVNLV